MVTTYGGMEGGSTVSLRSQKMSRGKMVVGHLSVEGNYVPRRFLSRVKSLL